ncbi:chitobiosyldiphosphodolichol beta-1,4 mannosyltransferase [Sporobolomyces koalae]|uniref:chitobiosyldiphosphodolichol beta-1,4 mannosyltransferase n=1 Tax=Sporobolomyces koalae TaxID=500713 RepID=UPI00317E5F74
MTLASALLGAVGTLAAMLFVLRWSRTGSDLTPKSVAVVVLGDIGRSPRMMYHAQSLLEHGFTTYIVAYRGTNPPTELSNHPLCHFVYLAQPLAWTSALPRIGFVAVAPFKVLLGAVALLQALVWTIPIRPAFIVVQNPPAIPTLPIVQLASKWIRSKLVIDWHNTGYSVLALRFQGRETAIVRIAKLVELTFGKNAFAHLMVTETMRRQLVDLHGFKGKTIAFHDRPRAHFRRSTLQEAHKLFKRLPTLDTISFPQLDSLPRPRVEGSTLFTLPDGSLDPDRPALVITSTSHTPDEDLSILLRALSIYDLRARESSLLQPEERFPRVVMLVTGKGQGKREFERQVETLEPGWEFVRVRTEWLEIQDYPVLLGCGDLGISLHTSTSGYDLPMKVVDMFGCQLPVLALEFPSIGELVQHGVNGRTFKTDSQLAQELIELLQGFPTTQSLSKLDLLRTGIKTAQYPVPSSSPTTSSSKNKSFDPDTDSDQGWTDWQRHWQRLVLPVFESVS